METNAGLSCTYCRRPSSGTYHGHPVCARCIEDYQLLKKAHAGLMGALQVDPQPAAPVPLPLDAAFVEVAGRSQARALLGGEPNAPLIDRLTRLQKHRALVGRSKCIGFVRGAFFEMEETVRRLIKELADADARGR